MDREEWIWSEKVVAFNLYTAGSISYDEAKNRIEFLDMLLQKKSG